MNQPSVEKYSNAIWNYSALGILAGSGLLFNLIIAKYYSPSVLGVFNQAFAFYIVTSQLSVLGVHQSILRTISKNKDRNEQLTHLSSALLINTFLGAIFGAIIFTARNAIGNLFESVQLANSLLYVGPALFFFGINKTLLAYFNAKESMKIFAFGQSLRYVMILGGICYFTFFEHDKNTPLAASFIYSEIVVFIYLIGASNFLFSARLPKMAYIIRHLKFGIQAFGSGILMELNSRIDVLMIGLFLGDREVGIYSFALLFAEGFLQLIVVAKNLVNPKLIKLYYAEKNQDFNELIQKTRKYIWRGLAVGIVATIPAFYVSIHFIAPDSGYRTALLALCILLLAMWSTSGLLVFDQLLMLLGRPFKQSIFLINFVVSNLLLNLILIPILGINGAALGTGLSFFFAAYQLVLSLKKNCQIDLVKGVRQTSENMVN